MSLFLKTFHGLHIFKDFKDPWGPCVYVDILTQISAICSKYEAEYICIGGDMNTDLVRLQSQNTQAPIQFAAKESLQFALNHSISDITHTFTSLAFDSFSTIDHFIVTSSLYQAIKSYT